MNLETMTAPQREAVLTDHPNVFAVAGPGSGKTTVLAARVQRLVFSAGIGSERIAILTYTNAAARNVEERIAGGYIGNDALTGDRLTRFDPRTSPKAGFAGTLHGFCLRMLREHGHAAGYGGRTAVLDEDGAAELLAAKAATMGCKEPLKKLVELKRRGRPTRLPGEVYTKADLVVLSYVDELAESGLLDFDLILTEFLRILGKQGHLWQAVKDRFDHVLVDEVQDSAPADWGIYAALPIPNKFLVGDPDQAIFGFRGGRVDLCVRHAQRADVKVVLLAENFRCATEICNAANALIRRNAGRLDKSTYAADRGSSGQVDVVLSPHANEGAEVGAVVDMITSYYAENDGTVAVLARTNAVAAAFREAIAATGTDVEEEPRSEMPPDWALGRALLEFLAQPDNDTLGFFYLVARALAKGALSQTEARRWASQIRRDAQIQGKTVNELWFNVPKDLCDVAGVAGLYADKEGLCRETVMTIAEMARALPTGATMLDLALEAARRDRPPEPRPNGGVTCTTIHGAKGREWDVVYLVGMEDEAAPGTRKDADVEEERRLFFVGLTRARGTVWITHAATRRATWGNRPIQERTPSRFIAEALP